MDDLLTARLVLHPMTIAEAEQVVSGQPGTGDRWAPGYPTPGEIRGAGGFLSVCASAGDPQPFGGYQIRLRDDGQAIGGVGFRGVPDENGTVEVGYGLIPAMRGQGYAAEALRGLLLFAHARGVACVTGNTTHDNTASQQVMTAVGMQLVWEDDTLRRYETRLTGPAA
jgi:RimJ/RimL family protein N-acetyltransferase